MAVLAVLLSACSEEGSTLGSSAQGVHAGEPPYWNGGTGQAVHHLPVPWPAEPAPAACGASCGGWLPYTRFQNALNDPRTQDPSNGGTSPQNYVNIASSCVDKALPSVYYALHKDSTDPSKDVLLFRWRVAQDAHTYATGPSVGAHRAGDPWSSALWTVLFNIDGSGYRTLAAHINGSAGSPSAPVDTLAGIYGKIPTQSINYLDDSDNIKLLGTQPTAFVDEGTGFLLNFQNSMTPESRWPNGSAETVWDYGTTRARLVTDRPCNEYFIDYQIPVAMLDATAHGGPKVTRSTPISMLFCTANSLNNPFQKDCALNREWTASINKPGPFGDFIAFDKPKPYAQPLITEVTAQAPSDCKTGKYVLTAKVLDALWVDTDGVVKPSVKAVSFWYYQDTNGNRLADDGNPWTKASNATLVSGKLNEWRAEWDSTRLLRGSILIGAQAVDDKTLVDDGMMPSTVDNRTFSYIKGDDQDELYRGAWKITNFPTHSPAMNEGESEDWYGNPPKVGVQVAGNVVDVTLNTCGSAPSLKMTGAPSQLGPGQSVDLTIMVDNTASPVAVDVSSLVGQLPPGFSYVSGKSSGDFGGADPVVSGTTLTWTLGTPVNVDAGASKSLVFVANASTVAGSYNAQASAATNAGTIGSAPVPLTVNAARASLTQTPSRYSVKPDGSTPVTYTITYANESSVPLSEAVITNVLPANIINFVGCTGGSTCSFSDNVVTWQLGTLAGGATGSVTFTVTVAPAFTATSLTNEARLGAKVPGSSTPLQLSSTSTIVVEQPVPAFSLTMTSDKVQAPPSTSTTPSSVSWTLTYANKGNGPATGSLLVDTLPAGFAFSNCSVVGNPHFTACTHSNGTVTFSGAGGAGVTVRVGETGSVTLTATVAVAPFTYPNPGVNKATISPSGGPGAAQAQSSVGVTGEYCGNVFYFRRGVDDSPGATRPASIQQPTLNDGWKTNITTSSTFNKLVFLQQEKFTKDTDLSNQSLKVNFTISASQGGGDTSVALENVTTKQVIVTTSLPISNGLNTYNYIATIPSNMIVRSTEELRWVFAFSSGGSRDFTFHYDTVQYPSRSAFCSATSPASLSLSNTVDKPWIAGALEKLTYTLRYANVGGSSASNVVLKDALPAEMTGCEYSTNGSTWSACSEESGPRSHDFSLGTLAAGASGTVFVRGDSPASPTPGQLLDNTATLTSNETSPVSATASTSIAGGGQPLLLISGAADKGVVGPGQKVLYTFTVENVGTGTATNVAVSNAIPADMSYYQYVPGSITGGISNSVLGNTLSWSIGTLTVGAKATLTFQMEAFATGLPSGLSARDDVATVFDTGSCTGAGCKSNTVTVMVNGNADLTLSSLATPTSPEPVPPGAFIDYTLTVGSVGSSKATGVVLSDELPKYTRFEAVTQGGSYDVVSNRVVFPLGDLAPGQTEVRKFRVRVDALPAGETLLGNVASVSASNAQLRTSTVQTVAKAEPKMSLVSTGPASLPGPAARLAASVSNATTLKVHSAALLEVGGYLLVNEKVTRITDIAGTTVTVESPVTGSAGAPLMRSAEYALRFANTGNAAAESVDVTGVLPAGWHYVTSQPVADTAPGVGETGSVSWSLGRVAAGASSSLRVVAIPTLTGMLQSTVDDLRSCTSGTTAGCSSSVTTRVGGLLVSKRTSTPVVSVGVGASARYTITLENSLGTDVTGVSVTDLLPSGFSYRTDSGTPAPDSGDKGQPKWSGLTVPARGQREITFDVDVAANMGTGTYDNWLEVVAPGVGVTPFDALGTTAEDVTVVGGGSFVAAGYVFRDRSILGKLDGDDTGLANVLVSIKDGSGALYSLQTDGFGYFQRILRTGTAGVTGPWTVSIPTGQNVLNGLALYRAYSMPMEINPSSSEAASMRFGYVSTEETTPPDAVDDAVPVAEDSGATVVDVLANDSAAPAVGGQLTVTAVTQPATGGSVTLEDGVVRFTPTPNVNGPVTFTYTVSDVNGGTDTATVTMTVMPVNDPPMAVDDTFSMPTSSGAKTLDVLANDTSAPDTGEELTVAAVTQPATGGTVSVAPNGAGVVFTPTPGFAGEVTFTYTVSDGNGGTDTATVTVMVENAPPKAVADTFSVPTSSGAKTLDVLANDTTDTGEQLTVAAVTQPATGGTVSVAPDGMGVVFTPAPGFTGSVTFTYTVSDGNGGTDTVTVTVNVGRKDSDNNGIDDETEVELGLDPNDPDDDDDGVLDSKDGLTDTDGDGVIDALDPDSDNDGLNDGTESGVRDSMELPGTDRTSPNYKLDSDPSTTTDPRDPDTDDDGLKDGTEDTDHDGYLDDTESDPNDVDTDDGGETDGAEASYGGNPRDYADDLAVAGRGCTSSGMGTLMPLALLLALPLLRRRQSRRDAVAAWGVLGLLVTVLVAAPASAQPVANVPSQGIDVQQYKPGPGLRDVLGVQSPQVGRHLDWNVGLSFNYAKDPLHFINPRTDSFLYELVKNQFTFDLMGSLALFDRFELGVAVPLTSQSSGSELSVAPLLSGGVHATGVGDLRLVPKAHLLSTDGGLHLGVVVPVLLPTSGGKGFLGRGGVAAFPRVLGEWTSKEGVRVLANVGLNLQPQEQLYNLNVGNEFAYGLGTEVPFKLGQHRLSAEATLVGALGLKQTQTEESPLELLGAVKYRFSDALAAHAGGGPGLTRGYGTPGFRLFAGLIWTEAKSAPPARVEPPPAAPVCPLGPEDKDGFQDEDGCADPDNDGDGLPDVADRCPNQPETKNGFEDSDGCADELPPPPPVDTDGDGLTDDQDRCPAVAEDKDGFEDEDGCADTDNDKDGVVDTADKCLSEPEVINGVEDSDGCPDKGKVKVLVEGQKIIILDKVYFATNKDVILSRSFSLLAQVAAVLRANPEITRVRVEGHTDSQSSDAFNLDLSQRRANNVRKRLVEEEGIAPERLEAVGYGESRPVDTNKTAQGRENNRRVEFIILEVENQVP